MPETHFEIQVSFREGDRARLLQAIAVDEVGNPIEDLLLSLEVDERGTFHIEEEQHSRELITGSNGAVYFSWWPWPRPSSGRNYTSTIRVTCKDESPHIYVEDLFE